MSAPFNPLTNKRSDESRTRTIARNAVQRFNLFVGQPDLDADPAFLARTFGRDLRFATFGHGNPQKKTAPEGAAGSGDQSSFGAGLVPPAGSLLGVFCEGREGVEVSADGFGHQEGDFEPCGFPAGLNPLDQVHRGVVGIGHVALRVFNMIVIWGTHSARQWGSHNYFQGCAS